MAEKLRFATRDLAERDRVPLVRDFYGRAIMGLDMGPLSDAAFDIDMSVVRIDSVGVAYGSISPLTAARTRALTADGNANILLGRCDSDFVTSDANGETKLLRGGDILFMPLDQEFVWTFPRAGMTTAIHLDRGALSARLPGFDPAGILCLNAAIPGADLLFSYARTLLEMQGMTPEANSLASRQLLDLAAFVISQAENAEDLGASSSVRSARYVAAKRDIAMHFHLPHLSIRDVAARQNVTVRYLQMLFDENGTTFTNDLQNTRLDFALSRLRLAKKSVRILDVALEAGFADLSTFNRLFRKRFGEPPKAFRACSEKMSTKAAG